MANGVEKPGGRRRRGETAPTTADAVEIAMDRIIAGEPEDGPARLAPLGQRAARRILAGNA